MCDYYTHPSDVFRLVANIIRKSECSTPICGVIAGNLNLFKDQE